MTARRRTVVVGVPVDDVTMEEALEQIVTFVRQGRGDGTTYQVATVNVDFVVNAQRDERLLELMRRVDLSLPDGMPIVWGARMLGGGARERVTGADLVPALAMRAAREGFSLYFYGAPPGVAQRAADLLRDRAPGITVTASSGHGVGPDGRADPADIEHIVSAAPDIVCVALGNPKQEWWIDRHRAEVGASVLIGVGGTFDLMVGDKRRAPQWMQRVGCEWIFRALQEPRRLVRRYARDIVVFGPLLGRQFFRERCRTRSRSAQRT